jgi:signal peptidase II
MRDLILVLAGSFVILVDQLTKRWVVQYFDMQSNKQGVPVPPLGNIVELIYVRNTGVAFSLLAGQQVQFLFIVVAVAVIGYLYWRNRETGSLLLKFSFGLVLGGAIGNLVDRFRLGYVVDFIHFHIPNLFDFAVFNVADSAISIGVVLLALLLWQGSATDAKKSDASASSAVATESSVSRPSSPRIRRRVTGE